MLSFRDQRAHGALSGEAKLALKHMWAEQKDDGKWSWLHFGLGPWETDGSEFWGASLAAVAAMSARDEVTPPADALARLRRYLRGGLSDDTSLHNRLSLLWAASTWDGLLSEADVSRLAGEVLERQRADGGFRLVDLAPWPSEDGSAPHQESDGYATALSTFVLQQLDEARFAAAITRGVMWLQRSQQADGRWLPMRRPGLRCSCSALRTPLRIARRIPTWAVASNSCGEPSASSRGKERSSQHGGEDGAR